jgi:hypothetical protein
MVNAAERFSHLANRLLLFSQIARNRNGLWHSTKVRKRVRLKSGKQTDPSAAIIDSQSVKTDEQAEVKCYDAGKD